MYIIIVNIYNIEYHYYYKEKYKSIIQHVYILGYDTYRAGSIN